ncbi:hypothetical protein CL656_01625 [bacterium]|nr:hypothetical protein [bacterium]|tara:strand:+ start:834 stop:1391 length:558 start_codon:yes stop_codon:yes gene_type:complete
MNIVPSTFNHLIIVFFGNPSVISVLFYLFYLYRINNFIYQDIVIYPSVFMYWTFNEWFIHNYLFHANFNWLGKYYHIEHHKKPYYHVSIDNFFHIWLWISFHHSFFFEILRTFNKHQYFSNLMIPYVLSGFMYMFLHYSAHCKYVPSNKYWRQIIEHHQKHHQLNTHKNFSFILPFFDRIFKTNI